MKTIYPQTPALDQYNFKICYNNYMTQDNTQPPPLNPQAVPSLVNTQSQQKIQEDVNKYIDKYIPASEKTAEFKSAAAQHAKSLLWIQLVEPDENNTADSIKARSNEIFEELKKADTSASGGTADPSATADSLIDKYVSVEEQKAFLTTQKMYLAQELFQISSLADKPTDPEALEALKKQEIQIVKTIENVEKKETTYPQTPST